jgi:SAM-dependent methyltransferase
MHRVESRNDKGTTTSDYFDKDYFSGKKKSSYLDYRFQSFKWKWKTAIEYFKQLGSKDKDYLDVGCAFGYLVNFAQPYFRSVKGVDISSYAVSEARKRYPEVDFIEADVTKKLPFPEKTFDFLSGVDVLEHFEDVDIALKEVYRVLKPGGYGYFSMPYVGLARKALGWLDPDRSHVAILTPEDYEEKFLKAGFSIKEQKKWWVGSIHFLVQKPTVKK